MKNKMVMILTLFALMAAMTGIASAYKPGIGDHVGYTCKEGSGSGPGDYMECLKASWDNINTKIDASSANTVKTNKACYQVRYYPENKFQESNLYDDESNTFAINPY
ncbi:MAG: hypothetical protein OIN87_12425 [Candidatus Methanoperedens sp.]|nr:hypothetical protein [Candidatus Methanoperedens sp.]